MEKITYSNYVYLAARNPHYLKKYVLNECCGLGLRLPALGFKKIKDDNKTKIAFCLIRTPRIVVYAEKISNMGIPTYEVSFYPTAFSKLLEKAFPNLKTIEEEINYIVNGLEYSLGYRS